MTANEEHSHELSTRRALAHGAAEMWLCDFQQERGLSDADLLDVLNRCQQTVLSYVLRDHDYEVTGHRRRLPGE